MKKRVIAYPFLYEPRQARWFTENLCYARHIHSGVEHVKLTHTMSLNFICLLMDGQL